MTMNDQGPEDPNLDQLMKLVLNDAEDPIEDLDPTEWPELNAEEAAVIEKLDISFLKKIQKAPALSSIEDPEPMATPNTSPIKICCRFCKGPFSRQEAVFCASCLAPHHVDCHQRHGQCSVLECGETQLVYSGPLPSRNKPLPLVFAAALGCLFGVAAMSFNSGEVKTTLPEKSVIEKQVLEKKEPKTQDPSKQEPVIHASASKPIELQIRALSLDFKPPQQGILLVPLSFDELFFHKVGWAEFWNIESQSNAIEQAALALQKLDYRIDELKSAMESSEAPVKLENRRVLHWLLKEIKRLDRDSEERVPGYLAGHLAYQPRYLTKLRE